MPEGMPAQIGRYKVLDEIGRGGFGRVYRALDPSVGRQVAIKVLTDGSRDILTRFRNEAVVAGNLRHKNIVTVYEYGEHEGKPFLAMEYLGGEDLHHIIASHKPLTLLQKCKIMSQVAEGLHYAHRNGVVHRDVKPANIMVLGDGTAKIMDFGIARLTADRDATRLTQEGCLIGTLLYMAPEQFAGSEVDALCDIFAYGVIFYELLTGRHPFEAPDSRAFMYRVSFEEPRPLRDLMDDCPEGLQRVISKVLQKDRELRYQTLEELQFDTDPIRIELQQQRAGALLLQAQELYDKQQLEPAQTVILEALQLDPQDRTARALWKTIQKQIQQRTLQPRIESLLTTGEQQLTERRFLEAVRSFESAIRLDRENPYVQNRLEQARGLLEHSKRAELLLAEAQKEFKNQNLTAAYRSISEALQHDPQNPGATEFLKIIQSAIQRAQREQKIVDAINKAKGLLSLHSYDEAIDLLAGLGPDSGDSRVEQILAQVRIQKEEQDRKKRLLKEMASASELLRDHRLAEAVACLDALKREFPENNEVAHFLAYAQKELEAEARAKYIEQVTAEASRLSAAYDFDTALAALDEALQKYPGEGSLIRVLGSTMTAKAAWERQQVIQATLQECVKLQSQQRFAQAIEMAEATLRDYGSDPALAALLAQLEQGWAQQRRAEAVRKAAEQVQKLLEQGQFEKAIQSAQQALAAYPGETVLLELADRARQELAALEKARALEAISREAAAHARECAFDRALEALDDGLKAWPEEQSLLRQRQEIVQAKEAWERQQAIARALEAARQLQDKKDFAGALNLISKTQLLYPEDPVLLDCERELTRNWEEHKRREAIASAVSEGRLLISRGRLEEAVEFLRDATARYPGDAGLEALALQAQDALRVRQRLLAIEKLLENSRDCLAEREFDRAREILEQGLHLYPGDPGLIQQLDTVMAAKAAWERQQAIRHTAVQVRQLAQDGRYPEALQLVVRSLREYRDEPLLLEAQREVETQWQEQRRRDAIAKTAAEANTLLEQGRLEEAISLLQDASLHYPREKEWEPLLARAQEKLLERRRAEAIAKLAREVRALAGQRKFPDALGMLERGLAEWPEDATLLELEASTQAAKTAWEREQEIQGILEEAGRLGAQGLFERALALAAESLARYPDEPALRELGQRLQREWELRQRMEAVSQCASNARVLLEEGRFEAAVQALREACARYPGEAQLTSLLARAEEELEARRRRDRTVQESKVLLTAGNFAEVIRSMQQLLARFPGDAEAASLLSSAQEQLAARQRAEAIQKLASETVALAGAYEFDEALALLESGLERWPGESRLLKLRESVRTGKAGWEREQARRKAVEAARNLGLEKRFSEALEALQAALSQFPEDSELLELQKDFRLRQQLLDARRLLEQARPAEALEILEEFASEAASEPELRALLERAREDLRAQQRADAIAQRANEARARADRKDFEGALAMLETALEQWPEEPPLVEVRRQVLAAKAAHERQQAITTAVRECERLEQKGRHKEALAATHAFLGEFPGEPGLLNLVERLERRLAEEERRRKRLTDLETLRDLGKSACYVSTAAQASEMLDLARGILARYPDDEEVRAAGAGPLRQLSDLDAARRELAAHNFPAVLEICNRYLPEYPGHIGFGSLKQEVERRQKLEYLEDLRRRAAAEDDLASRVRILEEGRKRYPEESWVADELRFTANKLTLITSILEKARDCEAVGQWDQALEEWKRLRSIHQPYPGLAAEIQRVQAARDRAQAEITAQWARQIEEQFEAGDLSKAGELLQRARADLPESAAIRELATRLEDVRNRRKQARKLFSDGQAAFDEGRLQEGENLLREALQLAPRDAAFHRLVLNRIAERAQAAFEENWHDAEFLLQTLRDLDPNHEAVAGLSARIEQHRREAAVSEALQRARELRQAGQLHAAEAELRAVLAAYPQEARLREQLARIQTLLEEETRRERRAEALRELGRLQTEAPAAKRKRLRELARELQALGAGMESDAEIAERQAAVSRAIAARNAELDAAQSGSRYKLAFAGVGIAAVLLAGAVFLPRLIQSGRSVPVAITSETAGASVSIAGKTCVTPDCVLHLPPATYTLTARKDGFKAISQTLTIPQQGSEMKVPLVFEPLPEVLQVNTNFESGRIFLDGRPAGDLRNGQFSVSGTTPGEHRLRITGGGAEFDARWRSAAGKPPELLGPISAKDVQAAVIANAGSAGSIACNCGLESLTVDGSPAAGGPASPGPAIPLPRLSEGARQIAIPGRSMVVDIRSNPALNVFLTLDRNVGTLVVVAREANAAVYLNNRSYGRTSERGMLRLPVEVGQYSLRVEKEGFRPAERRNIDVRKGEEEQITLSLAPMPPVLEIAGAQPGAQVKVDGRVVGHTDAGGALRAEVAAGEHRVELTKEDYTPVAFNAQFSAGKSVQRTGAQVAMSRIVRTPQPDPRQIEAQDWQRLRDTSNPADLEEFILKHPGGAHLEEARARIAQLRQRQQANAEQAAWDAVDKTRKTALQDFLSRYGNGAHAPEAQSILDKLQKQEAAEALARQREKEQRDKEQNEQARLLAEEQAITQTLRAFESAYNRRDLPELQKIWTGMETEPYRTQFRDAKALSFQLAPAGRPEVNGDTAKVNCTRTIHFTARNGQRFNPPTERVRVTLARAGTRWTIQSIIPY